MLYIKRNYRNKISSADLITYQVNIKESDLYVSTDKDLSEVAYKYLAEIRSEIEYYIGIDPDFQKSMVPVELNDKMPQIVRLMAESAASVGVGPMASVAGAVSEVLGYKLLEQSDEVIVENGGDIFFKIKNERTVAIFAGGSPLSMKIGIKLKSDVNPSGLCTSSATVGHSVSYGNADAVVCLTESAALSDAYATHLANQVIDKSDIEKILDNALQNSQIRGCVIIMTDQFGAVGDVEICKIKD